MGKRGAMTADVSSREARGKPVGAKDGVPVYASGDAPAYLRTLSGLARMRLKPADGQQPLAFVYTRYYGDRVGLYDPAAAVKMKPLGSTTKRAMAARRTCPKCGIVRQHIVRHGTCGVCLLKELEAKRRLWARTCQRCRGVRTKPFPKGRHTCGRCLRALAAEKKARQERLIQRAMVCSGLSTCTTQVATEAEVRAWLAANPHRSWQMRTCEPCAAEHKRQWEEHQRQQAERAQAEREARERAVRELEEWAAAALADPLMVVLDTETTGLDDEACIVDLAVKTAAGDVLLNTLVNPGVPIPQDATEHHGIADDDVRDAPSFSEILPRLTEVLAGRRCLIYNKWFDRGRLRWELTRHHRQAGHGNPAEAAAEWLDALVLEDVMEPYSDWVGEWSEYHGNYRWQPLGGPHRALGDCDEVLVVLASMAQAARVDAVAV